MKQSEGEVTSEGRQIKNMICASTFIQPHSLQTVTSAYTLLHTFIAKTKLHEFYPHSVCINNDRMIAQQCFDGEGG